MPDEQTGSPPKWDRFFIADKSVTVLCRLPPNVVVTGNVPLGLRYGYGFMCFNDQGVALFTSNPSKVKLYEKLEEAKTDFAKVGNQVALHHISIQVGQGSTVTETIIEENKCKL